MDANSQNYSEGSSMVRTMVELYRDPSEHLDFTYGYPERINPNWITQYQISVPKEVFLDETIGIKFIKIIEGYFLNLFRAANVSLAPTAGYAIAFMCDAVIRSPGDEIIIQDVSFEPYPKLIESYKGKAVVAARGENFAMSIDNIKAAVTDKTKAIIIVNPDNPTGQIYSKDAMREIVNLCVGRNITLVLDHTFFQITQSGKTVPLITGFAESQGLSYIIIGDTGKILGLKGSKFGALLYSNNWKELLSEVLSNYFFQHEQYDLYLIASIFNDPRFNDYLALLNNTIAENYTYINDNLSSNLKLLPMSATVFCLIDISATGLTDGALCQQLLAQHIGVIPITDFYYDRAESPGHLIRVALSRPLAEIQKFAEAINKLPESY